MNFAATTVKQVETIIRGTIRPNAGLIAGLRRLSAHGFTIKMTEGGLIEIDGFEFAWNVLLLTPNQVEDEIDAAREEME